MEKKYSVIDWLIHLSKSFKDIGATDPFCAIWLIACGIELMGECIHTASCGSSNGSRTKFDVAINTIPAFQEYRSYPENLYHDLRCGLAHTAAPDGGLLLKRKGKNEFNLPSKRNIISFEQLAADFSAAVQQLQSNMVNVPEGRLESYYISIIEDAEDIEGGITGSTNSNCSK